jgi:hypothetical protein
MVNITPEPAQAAYCAILPDWPLNRQRANRYSLIPLNPGQCILGKLATGGFTFTF